jgi:insertion element IS1 protein InsB
LPDEACKGNLGINDQTYTKCLLTIHMIVTNTCSSCESPDLVRNEHDYKGSQNYHGKDYGRYGTLNARQGYEAHVQRQVKLGVLEHRLTISRRTISRWLAMWIDQVPPLETSLVPADIGDVLELDELWSFVGNKQQPRWVWLALCRRTRQVVAYWMGDRTETAALQLWRRILREYVRCASFSDGWQPYRFIFDYQRHQMVGKATGETNHVEPWFNTL